MTTQKAVALRISNLLIKNNLSKYRLEKESGLTHSALRYIFNEINNDVKFSTICKVASAFNMTLEEFFDDDLFKLKNLDFD